MTGRRRAARDLAVGFASALLGAHGGVAQTATLDLGSLNPLETLGPTVRVTVSDPVYGTRKQYEGYPLAKVLARISGLENLRHSDAEVIFHCLDGYRPSISLERLLESRGYLAVRDVAAGEALWSSIEKNGSRFSPAPYYVVWEDVAPEDHSYPWPYQLRSIEIAPFNQAFRDAMPGKNPAARKGFQLFRDNCIKCHSVNLAGGALGSELNVPRSILEYWRPREIRQFIHDPSAVRARSKMPPMDSLSDRDLDLILAYFADMKGRKICNGRSGCSPLAGPAAAAAEPSRAR